MDHIDKRSRTFSSCAVGLLLRLKPRIWSVESLKCCQLTNALPIKMTSGGCDLGQDHINQYDTIAFHDSVTECP